MNDEGTTIKAAMLVRNNGRTVSAVRTAGGETFRETLDRAVGTLVCANCGQPRKTYQQELCVDCLRDSLTKSRLVIDTWRGR